MSVGANWHRFHLADRWWHLTLCERLLTCALIPLGIRQPLTGATLDGNISNLNRQRRLSCLQSCLLIHRLSSSLSYVVPCHVTAMPAGVRVEKVTGSTQSDNATVRTANGKELTASRGVVVATEGPAAQKVLGEALELSPSQEGAPKGTCNLYFRRAVCWACVGTLVGSAGMQLQIVLPLPLAHHACVHIQAQPALSRVETRWQAKLQSRNPQPGSCSAACHADEHPQAPCLAGARDTPRNVHQLYPALMQDCYCPATGQHPVPERRWHGHRQQRLLPKHRCALICTPGPGESFASGLLSLACAASHLAALCAPEAAPFPAAGLMDSQVITCHKSAALHASTASNVHSNMLLVLLLQHLVSLSTIGTHDELSDDQLASQAKQQMAEWFGPQLVDDWQLLKVYRIFYAQPPQVGLSEPQQTTVWFSSA